MRIPTDDNLVWACPSLLYPHPHYCQYSLPHYEFRRIIILLCLKLFGCIQEVISYTIVIYYVRTCIQRTYCILYFQRTFVRSSSFGQVGQPVQTKFICAFGKNCYLLFAYPFHSNEPYSTQMGHLNIMFLAFYTHVYIYSIY